MALSKVLLLTAAVAALAAAGCQRGGVTTTRDGGPRFAVEYATSGVSLAEGEMIRVELVNAGDREQQCVVEIYGTKGTDLINTRGEPTSVLKSDDHRLNPRAAASTEYKTKTAGQFWVRVRSTSGQVAPQAAFGTKDKGSEPRVTYKAGDFVKTELYGGGGGDYRYGTARGDSRKAEFHFDTKPDFRGDTKPSSRGETIKK